MQPAFTTVSYYITIPTFESPACATADELCYYT